MAANEYQAYLARFDQHVGALAVGAYGKWKGRLVRKLSAEEFATKHGEFTKLDRTYREILERGDTINDAVTRLLRERQAELLLEDDFANQ
jgi:hypothetical protein